MKEQAPLTPTQLRVLILISHGKTSSEIADLLGYKSEKTIESHREKLFKRLGGVSNAAHAVRLGFERGLLQPNTADADLALVQAVPEPQPPTEETQATSEGVS